MRRLAIILFFSCAALLLVSAIGQILYAVF